MLNQRTFFIVLFFSSSFCRNQEAFEVGPSTTFVGTTSIEDLDLSDFSAKIVGGDEVRDPNPYPWQVLFVSVCLPYQRSCGATLIQSNVIMTAAHCWWTENDCDTLDDINILVQVGRDIDSPDEVIYDYDGSTITRIEHPNFNITSLENDIALLILSEPFTVVDKFPQLADETDALEIDEELYVIGWGALAFEGDSTTILREVVVEAQSDDDCDYLYEPYWDEDIMICAGGILGQDSCQGDSGGPLFEMTDCCEFPGVVVHGIVSFGFSCAVYDAVYVKVSAFRAWIDEEIEAAGLENEINQPTCCECDGSDGDIGATEICLAPPSPSPPSPSPSPPAFDCSIFGDYPPLCYEDRYLFNFLFTHPQISSSLNKVEREAIDMVMNQSLSKEVTEQLQARSYGNSESASYYEGDIHDVDSGYYESGYHYGSGNGEHGHESGGYYGENGYYGPGEHGHESGGFYGPGEHGESGYWGESGHESGGHGGNVVHGEHGEHGEHGSPGCDAALAMLEYCIHCSLFNRFHYPVQEQTAHDLYTKFSESC